LHNNYYFLRQLSDSLNTKLQGFTIVSCFSQNKEELILELNDSNESFFIKASLQPSFCCLSFPSTFSRAKKNSIDLFQEVELKKVVQVRQFSNERSFAFELESRFTLLFKMHGNLSNLVLFREEEVIGIFRNQFLEDFTIKLSELDRTIDWSKESFVANNHLLAKTYFTLGKETCQLLETSFAKMTTINEKWEFFQHTLNQLTHPAHFSIVERNGKVALTLLPTDHTLAQFTDPIKAITDFFHRYTSKQSFADEKARRSKEIIEALKRAESYIKKNQQKLDEITHDQQYQRWADLIMANMQLVKIGMKNVLLTDFYSGAAIDIKLKPELNAQQNAQVFYRKAKNQQIEINKLRESIQSKQNQWEQLKSKQLEINAATDFKLLKPLYAKEAKKTTGNVKQLPYHVFEHQGFQIWVGKNAEANDELTLKHSFKEDLWLHAKDVPGSHVLVKYQSGKNFPKDVIERAAELAAYNSKRKTDTLCPVAFTPKKYVRKRKGDPAGAVVVEKEDVVLVRPRL
jgi:predicted ribosome quality control (RQC) complex YloA/Tae2 family protein